MVPVSAAAHITMKKKKDYADTSNITITGGEITASGGYYGAGIGAGCYGDASNIRIEAMHMLPPFQTVVLPLDPVIMRQATVILPSPIMPLWRLLA